MELVKGGQLKDLIDARFKSGRGFTDEEVSLIMKSIFSAVKHFHAKEIVHRDLKPGSFHIIRHLLIQFLENILVQDWEDLTSIKIADFGLSTQFSIDGFVRSLRQKCGTMIYMAPELALEEKYGKVLISQLPFPHHLFKASRYLELWFGHVYNAFSSRKSSFVCEV